MATIEIAKLDDGTVSLLLDKRIISKSLDRISIQMTPVQARTTGEALFKAGCETYTRGRAR